METDQAGISGSRSHGLRQHPVLAAVTLALAALAAYRLLVSDSDQLLLRNMLATCTAASVMFFVCLLVIPRWAPKINQYLWTEPTHVPVQFSVSVAMVSFVLSFAAILALLYYGKIEHPGITEHWDALWALVFFAAVLPVTIAIFIGLDVAGATDNLPWLNVRRLITTGDPAAFNDWGRIFIVLVASVTVTAIQGGIVLTGGLSVSPFGVVLVSAVSVAALASERPGYAVLTAFLCWFAAGATEGIGSYEPPSREYYGTAHLIVFTISLGIGLLVDLGRKRSAKQREHGRVSGTAA